MSATSLTPRQRKLAEDFVSLAKSLAFPFVARWPHLRDEFISSALFGLVQAARSYDPAREVGFDAHADRRIKGAILDVLRGIPLPGWKGDADAPTAESLNAWSEETGRVVAPAPDRLPAGPKFEEMLALLPPAQAEVLRRVYRDDEPVMDAAEKAGFTRKHAARTHDHSLKRLRKCLGGRDR